MKGVLAFESSLNCLVRSSQKVIFHKFYQNIQLKSISLTLISQLLIYPFSSYPYAIYIFIQSKRFMQPRSPEDQKRRVKISLTSNQQDKSNLNIEQQLIRLAINKSYIKTMAQNTAPLNVEQTIETVGNFVLSFVPKVDIQKELEEYWCIVALNEDALNSSQQGSKLCTGTNVSTIVDPKKLKLYQLFIGLGYREFRLQSLQVPKRKFYFNVDTIESTLVYSDANEPHSNNRIRIIVQNRWDVDFYINQSTLPFQFAESRPVQESLKMCNQIAYRTLKIVQKSVEESKGKLYKLPSKLLPDQQQFFYNRFATEQQFSKYCQTGDVILFRDNHTFAKVQRFLTNSECDHIGMVFKDEKYGLCIFQSNSGTGVSLAMWNQLIRYKWFENIEGIYWRRLNMQNKPQNFEDKVRQFVKVNLHKEYGFSLGKLLQFKEIVYENEAEEKNRTYFCSQLVAALYKYLGLLEPGKPSSSYLPKDFTDKGSMNMINNTALEAERRLIFNENLLKETYRFYK